MSTHGGGPRERVVEVVTAIVTARGRILLLRRSTRVSSFRGRWAGVSGVFEAGERPRDAALREIAEETGLASATLAVAAEGRPILVDAPAGDRCFRVHPVLVLARGEREPFLNWESAAARWAPPEEVERLAAVPKLRDVIESLLGEGATRVSARERRGLDRILLDRTRGCLALAHRSALLLARAAESGTPPSTLARLLAIGRPSFFGIANACADALAARMQGGRKGALAHAAALPVLRRRAAAAAARGLRGRRVLVTMSASGTVEETLKIWMRERTALEVRVLESRPPAEGAALASRLALSAGVRIHLYPDAAVEHALEGADAVLVGADAIFRDGGLANKTGSLPLARCAAARRVPFHAVAESIKRARTARQEALWIPEDGPSLEYRPPVRRAARGHIILENPSFERVPARLVAGIWGDRPDGTC